MQVNSIFNNYSNAKFDYQNQGRPIVNNKIQNFVNASPLKINGVLKADSVQFKGTTKPERPKTIYIFMGGPGSGKGTQAKILAKHLGIAHISTGDMLREAAEKGTENGLKAKEYSDKGKYAPFELFSAILIDRLNENDCKNGYILDGFPRTMEQIEWLESMNESSKKPAAIKVVKLEVDEKLLVERLLNRAKLEGRADDNPETIQNRLNTYNKNTKPLLEYFDKKGVLSTVNGNRSVKEISEDILDIVEEEV